MNNLFIDVLLIRRYLGLILWISRTEWWVCILTLDVELLRPAVFFDRDGVINVDTGYVYLVKDFIWIDGAKEAIRYMNQKNFLVFIVTNQSGIARGYYKERHVNELHFWINKELRKIGAHIDGFYYCPHHPEAKIEQYRKMCNCRKPAAGLILKAFKEWPINTKKSILIGDKETDIEAANNAGIKGYLFNKINIYEFITQLSVRPSLGREV